MKRFILRFVVFLVPLCIVLFMGALLPTTPKASKSLILSAVQKDSLMEHAEGPRLIFVGGSNLSFGLDSERIRDSLKINPINTGIHASIGLKYMVDNSLQYIQKGDVVVLVPEYMHFYRDINSCSDELLRSIFDVDIDNIKLLNGKQLMNLISFLPKYSLSKLKFTDYFGWKEHDIYSVNSFNSFGDANAHWNLKDRNFPPYETSKDVFQEDYLETILNYQSVISQRDAVLYISFPGLQSISYENIENQVIEVEKKLQMLGIPILGNARQYKMPNNMVFNTPYHLNIKGVEHRTNLVISELKKVLKRVK